MVKAGACRPFVGALSGSEEWETGGAKSGVWPQVAGFACSIFAIMTVLH
jgi:hypothetical protein